MLVSSDLFYRFTILAERKSMLAKFCLQGEGKFGGLLEEISGRQGLVLVSGCQEVRLVLQPLTLS
jgi:hypothetical protein